MTIDLAPQGSHGLHGIHRTPYPFPLARGGHPATSHPAVLDAIDLSERTLYEEAFHFVHAEKRFSFKKQGHKEHPQVIRGSRQF